jgi:hypothetical protein
MMFIRRLRGRPRHTTFAKPVHLEVVFPRLVLLMTIRVGDHFARCARYYAARVTQEYFIYPVMQIS